MAFLLVLGLLEFVRGALVFSILPLYGRFVAGFSMEVIGTAISLHYLFDNIFRIPAGWLTDRFGGKRLLITGIVVSGIGISIISFRWNTYSFILGAVLFGLGISPVWPVVISGIAAKMPVRQIGEALSKVFMAWLVGAGIGPVIINFVIEKSYRISFLTLLGLLALALLLTIAIKMPRITNQGMLSQSVFLKELFHELISHRVLYPGMFVQTMSVGILMPVIVIYAKKVFGLSPEQFNYLLIGGGIFTVLFLVPAGKLADRLGVKGPLVGGFLLASVCLILLPLQRLVVRALIVGAILGISYSFILPAWNGLMARAVSAEKRGTMWAIFMTIEGLGTAVGTYIGGKVWDTLGYRAPFYVSAFILISVAVFYAFGNIEKLIKEHSTDKLTNQS
ncbi:MFS transporter [Thermincola ferriacetica]